MFFISKKESVEQLLQLSVGTDCVRALICQHLANNYKSHLVIPSSKFMEIHLKTIIL